MDFGVHLEGFLDPFWIPNSPKNMGTGTRENVVPVPDLFLSLLDALGVLLDRLRASCEPRGSPCGYLETC